VPHQTSGAEPASRASRTEAIARTAKVPAAARGFLFDFDGTLSPIALEASAAQPAPGTADALAALRRVAGAVLIVSARPVSFLRSHFAGLEMFGLYGLEHALPDGQVVVEPEAERWRPVVADALSAAHAEFSGTGTLVEEKGLSLAVHYRAAPQRGEHVRAWAAEQAERTGLWVQDGRMVVELKPPVRRDKGTTVARVAQDLGSAWYVGDDVSDLEAFGALSAERTRRPEFFGVRVAVANPESGGALADAADFSVESPEDVVKLVAEIAAALD
jgi:trehalose 6-phosphate phosphatase